MASVVEPLPNSGGVAGPDFNFNTSEPWEFVSLNGADGRVVLRFTFGGTSAPQPDAQLATTGSSAVSIGMLALGSGVAAGAALMLARRARRG